MIKAHNNEIKPLISGTICFVFLVLLTTCGVVGAFF
jgi:hypothetical protein